MEAKLSELTKMVGMVDPQDVGTADVTSPVYVSAANYKRLRGLLIMEAVNPAETATIQLLQATSAGGAGSKPLSAVVTFTAGGAPESPRVEAEANVDAMDAANGFTFVGVVVGSSHATKLGAAYLQLGQPAYMPAS